MAVIEVTGLTKRYGRAGTSAEVLHQVSLTLPEGRILGLLGPNGAGKTTLIKILAGLLRPDAGTGTVLGFDLLRESPRIRAGVSLVAPTVDVGIDNNLTVAQNLAFWAPVYGLVGRAARIRIDELLSRLALTDKASVWPMHLSAGQRQRLALARSLLAENRLVFLDEPTAKLDAEGVRSVRTLVADLNREHGVTVVLTTHVMAEAEELCTDLAFLRQGDLLVAGPTERLLRTGGADRGRVRVRFAPALPGTVSLAETLGDTFARLPGVTQVCWEVSHPGTGIGGCAVLRTSDPVRTTRALVRAIVSGDVPVVGLETEQRSLEEVFRAWVSGSASPDTEGGRGA